VISMRVALISDIHGNLVALKTVLTAIDRKGVDQILCLGDVAATGPQPHDVVARLQALGCPVVMGNADVLLLNPQFSETVDEATRQIEEVDSWCALQLTKSDLAYIRTFQPTIEFPLDTNVKLFCFHGSPRSNTEIIEATTSEDKLEQMFVDTHALVMAGGHTHVQMLRRYREGFILNPGSVGLPYERGRLSGDVYNPPWAEYALVTWENASLSIELKRVHVDIGAVKRAILECGMPYAELWAKDWRKS
jgi:putative phosphoesterase